MGDGVSQGWVLCLGDLSRSVASQREDVTVPQVLPVPLPSHTALWALPRTRHTLSKCFSAEQRERRTSLGFPHKPDLKVCVVLSATRSGSPGTATRCVIPGWGGVGEELAQTPVMQENQTDVKPASL